MRISDWSSDVCSSDLMEGRERVVGDLRACGRHRGKQRRLAGVRHAEQADIRHQRQLHAQFADVARRALGRFVRCAVDRRLEVRIAEAAMAALRRSEEHTSELQSLMRISYAVFCLKKKKQQHYKQTLNQTKQTLTKTD